MQSTNNTYSDFPEDFKIEKPKNQSSYFTPEKGENQIRILSKAEVGYEYFSSQTGKPVRSRTPFNPTPKDLKKNDKGEEELPKQILVFKIYDYKDKTIKIASFSQITIKNPLLLFSKRFGSLKNIDIYIDKQIEKQKTTYTLMPRECPLTEEIEKLASETPIDFDKYFNSQYQDETPKNTPNQEIRPEDLPF